MSRACPRWTLSPFEVPLYRRQAHAGHLAPAEPINLGDLCVADELTLAIWPHAFEALVTVSLRDSPEEGLDPGCALRYVLQIYNPGPARLLVATALSHSKDAAQLLWVLLAGSLSWRTCC